MILFSFSLIWGGCSTSVYGRFMAYKWGSLTIYPLILKIRKGSKKTLLIGKYIQYMIPWLQKCSPNIIGYELGFLLPDTLFFPSCFSGKWQKYLNPGTIRIWSGTMDREVIGGLERGVHIWTIEPLNLRPNHWSQLTNQQPKPWLTEQVWFGSARQIGSRNPNLWGEHSKKLWSFTTYIPEN